MMIQSPPSLLLAVALAISGWAPSGGQQAEVEKATPPLILLVDERVFSAEVERVVAGDTVIVRRAGKSLAVCLAGVDAPEEGQSFWSEARRHASDLLVGEAVTVRLRGLDGPARCDSVGRVLLEGQDVGVGLLRAGLAWYCDRSARPDSTLAEAEAGARAAERGLWSDPEPVPPWVFRGSDTCLEEGGA